MFVIVSGIVVLLITVKIVNYFANIPEEQIQRKLPELERVPPYDPRDNLSQVEELKEPPNEMWLEVTAESNDFKEKKREYNYTVKAKVSKRFIFSLRPEIYSVVVE